LSTAGPNGSRDLVNQADAFTLDEEDDEAVGSDRNLELEDVVTRMLTLLGEDPDREGLVRTPLRVARAMETLTSGYRMSVEKIVNNAVFSEKYDEIVSIKNIHFFSMCEHHMLPFYGIANIGYIPDGKVVGLSKIPRIVDMFARRLQLQERLTTQIAYCLNDILEPRGVAVVLEGFHLCMMMRGVEKQDCTTVTSCMLGDFRSNVQTRNEFMSLCGSHTILKR
jgi:GTP cyclohydrolase I